MGKKERMLEQHPELKASLIDIIMSIDPSDNNRYTEFIIKSICKNSKNLKHEIGEMLLTPTNARLLGQYHEHFLNNRIRNTDISTYKSFKDVDVLFDTPEFLVILPHTYESMVIYGKGTKWCVTQRISWDAYRRVNRIIVIIDRIKNIKYAVQLTWARIQFPCSEIQGWTQADKQQNILIWDIDPEILKIIQNICKKTLAQVWVERALNGYFGYSQDSESDIEISKLSKAKYDNFMTCCAPVLTSELIFKLDKMYDELGKDGSVNKRKKQASRKMKDKVEGYDNEFDLITVPRHYDDVPF